MKTDRLRTLPSTKLLSKIGSSSPKALTEILFGSIPKPVRNFFTTFALWFESLRFKIEPPSIDERPSKRIFKSF